MERVAEVTVAAQSVPPCGGAAWCGCGLSGAPGVPDKARGFQIYLGDDYGARLRAVASARKISKEEAAKAALCRGLVALEAEPAPRS